MNGQCKTNFGKFRVKMDGNNINVGGRNFCVNIALYEKEACLYWLKTDAQGCELNEKDIRGENTVKMVDLGFSLLRKYYQYNYVTLLDDSGFSWKDKRDRVYKTNFLKGYLLLHGKTWYEDKFNAVMCDSDIYTLYRQKASNFNDPSKKPATFNFMNEEVRQKLEPLYISSNTWREFIDKFVRLYGEDKYKLMYDWYRSAIYIIFDGMEINQNWKIDLLSRPYIECVQEGGFGKTRKSRSFRRLEPFIWSP
jgi:hypothetical protein